MRLKCHKNGYDYYLISDLLIINYVARNLLNMILLSFFTKVAAQTGHDVVLVDVNDGVLKKSEKIIKDSLMRVARRKFPANKKVLQTLILQNRFYVIDLHSYLLCKASSGPLCWSGALILVMLFCVSIFVKAVTANPEYFVSLGQGRWEVQ